jgi:hypothetical protein
MMESKYLALRGVRQPPLNSRGGLIHVLETFAGQRGVSPGNLHQDWIKAYYLVLSWARTSRNQKGISNNEQMLAKTEYQRKTIFYHLIVNDILDGPLFLILFKNGKTK